jgi:hypothetical protein
MYSEIRLIREGILLISTSPNSFANRGTVMQKRECDPLVGKHPAAFSAGGRPYAPLSQRHLDHLAKVAST